MKAEAGTMRTWTRRVAAMAMLLFVLLTSGALAAGRTLKSGSTGSDVADLQTRLTQLGYYSGAVSGSFDSATRTAVKDFQTANGIKASGTADAATQDKMASGACVTRSQYDQVRPLTSKDSGAAVVYLQNQLIRLGYLATAADGKYSTQVQAAVKEFQAANGIKATGKADAATRAKLNGGSCVSAADYYKVCELKQGAKGGAVQVLQSRLKELEYYDGALNGVYDAEVKNAVKAFQTANSLSATGRADSKTRALMNGNQAVSGATYNLVCPLKSGSTGTAVKTLQRQLQQLGYYGGAIDGKYSSALKSAVKTFQTANGIKASGAADEATRKAITSGKGMTAAQYDQVRPLKSGERSEAVKLVARQLTDLGYFAGVIDGYYNSALKSAVKTFQTANSLKATGTADVATRALLNSGKGMTAAQYDKARPLSTRDSGAAVALLQEQLQKLGYFVDAANGRYSSSTKKAVAVFQTANGIKATGTADVNTRVLLNSGKGVSRAAYDASRSLSKGDVGGTVRDMQNRLIQLGYMSGTADGSYQSSTQKAVKLLQKALGRKETGVADVELRAYLFSAQAISYAEYEKTRALQYGERGDGVKQVQDQLKALGYFTGASDGKYGSALRKAVLLYQQANGLGQNGSQISAEMRATLNRGQGVSLKDYYAATPLKQGDTGDVVKMLQTRLNELGYYTGSINGKYNDAVVSAVKEFQLASGLDVTGTADANTRVVMNRSTAVTYAQFQARGKGGSGANDREATIEKLIAAAKDKLGARYVHYTSGPLTFDCSGFTKYVFSQVGIKLSGASYNQGYMDKLGGTYIKKLTRYGELQRGDLLVFDTDKSDGDLSDHVGIYLGDGTFIHASSSKGKVVISNLIAYGNFSWAYRLI